VTTESSRVPAGSSPERVGFFTDAVFAIAMTLLVIEIPRPEEAPEFTVGDGVGKAEAAANLWHFLTDETGSFVAYFLAFLILWTAWRQHHRLFDSIERVSPGVLAWHFPLLLLIGFLPYPTSIIGHHTHNPAAALLFTVMVGALMVCRAGVQSQALRDGLVIRTEDQAVIRHSALISWAVTGYWILTLVLCWWTPWVIIAWSVSPVLPEVLRAIAGWDGRRRPTSIGSS